METNWWLPIGYVRSESTPFRRVLCAGDRDFARIVASAYILENSEQMTSLRGNNVNKVLMRQYNIAQAVATESFADNANQHKQRDHVTLLTINWPVEFVPLLSPIRPRLICC